MNPFVQRTAGGAASRLTSDSGSFASVRGSSFAGVRLRRAVVAVLALCAAAAPLAQITAPALNWALPLFTKEGYRSMTARGSAARATHDRRFEVVDLNLTFFTGDSTNAVDSVILSPAATFVPDEKRAHGENHVRYIRDDVEASGLKWIYHHADKKISLDGNVRVVFRAKIEDLLR